MTIKQQGGIFGRNPSFNDAEIDDLTVTGSSALNGSFSVQGTAGKLNQTAGGNVLQIASGMNTEAAIMQLGINRSGDGSSYFDLFGTTGGVFGARFIRNGGANGSTLLQSKGTGNLILRTDNAAPVIIQTGGAEAARFNTSGNLAFPSGQGIDFSATSGTGTSELFSDYEEGSWSPTLTTDGTDFSSVSYDSRRGGSYTKIGRMVHIQLTMITDSITVGSASGNVVIGGLPFPPTTTAGGGTDQGYAALSVANGSNWTSNPPTAARVHETGSYIQLMIGATLTAIADANTGSNDNYVNISGTYITD